MYICVIDYKFFKLTKQKKIIMKKKLLYLTSILLFSAASINAQKTWDFTADVTAWPSTSGNGVGIDGVVSTADDNYTETVNDQLGLFVATAPTTITNFAAITSSSASFADGYAVASASGGRRLQFGGAGYTSTTGFVFMPTQRHIYFNVSGACTVKVWFKTGSTGVSRILYATDGTKILGQATSLPSTDPNKDTNILTANVDAAGKVYIFGDGSANLYKIEVIGAAVITPSLAVNNFQKESAVVVSARNGKINLSNVKSSTKVSVYNVLGSLVKSIQADADTSLDINSGFYIVKTKSVDGEKSVKVMVQ